MNRLVARFALGLLLASPLLAQTSPELEDVVTSLVRRLESEDSAERDEAARQLAELGPPALEILLGQPAPDDLDARERVAEVIEFLRLEAIRETYRTLDLDFRQFPGPPPEDGVEPRGEILWTAALDLPWVTGEGPRSPCGAIGSGGVLYFVLRGLLVAFDLATRTPRWHQALPGACNAAPALLGDHVLITSCAPGSTGRIASFATRDGAPAWEVPLPAFVHASPLVLGDAVVVAYTGQTDTVKGDGRIALLRAVDGSLVWRSRGLRPAGFGVRPCLWKDRLPAGRGASS